MTKYSLWEAKNEERAEVMATLVEHLQRWIGQTVEVKIQLTQRYSIGDYDRHGTTSTYFEFKLDYVGIAFSGAKLMLLDDAERASLEAFTDIFVELLIEETKVIFVEKHKGNIGRRITIDLSSTK